MSIEYDPAKDAINQCKHGISLADVVNIEWGTAQIQEDTRFDYGEQRFIATGYIGLRLYRTAFCIRDEKIRVISLRKTNKREERRYAQAQA